MNDYGPIDEYVDDKGRPWQKWASIGGGPDYWTTTYAEHPTTGELYVNPGGEYVKFPGIGSVETTSLYTAAHPSKGLHSTDFQCAIALAKEEAQ